MKGYWPTPKTQDQPCSECIEQHKDKLIPAMPPSLIFTGRFLDSQACGDFQQPFKTARAESVRYVPSLHRIYFQIGSAVFGYNTDTFFSRLASGEPLAPASYVPVSTGGWTRLQPPAGNWDAFLQFDSYFYAENTPANGWDVGASDGQRRLFGFDVDDQGFLYLAYSLFGWGIVKENATGLMQSYKQVLDADVNPTSISVVQSFGRYYALVGGGANLTNSYDVTDRRAPVKLTVLKKIIAQSAKNSALDRIAFVGDGTLQIYDAFDLISGAAPLVQFSALGQVNSVCSDGTNFYIASDTNSGIVLSKFAPLGTSLMLAYTRTDYPFPSSAYCRTTHVSFSDGYLVWAGTVNGQDSLRVFKFAGDVVTELDFANYFQRYYVSSPAPYTTPNMHAFVDSTVVRQGAKTYLIATAYSLGDVYELPPDGYVPPPIPEPPPVPPPAPPQPPPVPPVPVPVPQPPTPPPTVGCPPIVPGQNVFITCSAPSGGSQLNPVFKVGEPITFEVMGYNYDFSCAPHTFVWNIVGLDGLLATTRAFTAHPFDHAGIFPIHCTVTVNGAQSVISQNITVKGELAVPASDLLLDRFLVQVSWKDHDGKTGTGTRISCPALGNQTALFWFFSETNLELTVKAIDGRALGGHWWIFYGSMTDVEFTLTVTDTIDGHVRSYRNESGTMASVGDTSAF